MKYFIDAFRKYAVFSGRATRREYWMFMLWYLIVTLVFILVVFIFASVISGYTTDHFEVLFFELPIFLYVLAVFLPVYSLTTRRLHDTNHSGWWVVLNFVPVVNIVTKIVTFVFEVLPSQPGDNKYGPNPYGIPAVPPQNS